MKKGKSRTQGQCVREEGSKCGSEGNDRVRMRHCRGGEGQVPTIQAEKGHQDVMKR